MALLTAHCDAINARALENAKWSNTSNSGQPLASANPTSHGAPDQKREIDFKPSLAEGPDGRKNRTAVGIEAFQGADHFQWKGCHS